MLKSCNHVGLAVSDLDRSLAFYRDLLGLEVEWQRVYQEDYVRRLVGYPQATLRCAYLKLPGGGAKLELLQYQGVPRQAVELRRADPGNAHVCWAVEDLEPLYERLRAAGVQFVSAPVVSTAGPFKGTKTVYLEDPDGISLQLTEFPAGVAEP
jgi:catechol 2,3-dioxygenase-like lactoylglutathione lyase family enzyme